MARRIHRKSFRSKRRSHRSRKSHRNTKNIINKTVGKSVSVVKSTSRKYMPKVKSGLENVGSKVVKTGEQSVPYLQSLTRKFFSKFSGKTRKH
jgi:hypothetical protein